MRQYGYHADTMSSLHFLKSPSMEFLGRTALNLNRILVCPERGVLALVDQRLKLLEQTLFLNYTSKNVCDDHFGRKSTR